MDVKINFKGTTRKVKNRKLDTIEDLQLLANDLFKNKLIGKAEYFYIDSDDDEIALVDNSDLATMKEDLSESKKPVQIKIKLKIEKILNEEKKQKKKNFIVDSQTGKKLDFESSCSKSRSVNQRGENLIDWKRQVFEKKLIKMRAKKQKDKINLEYNRKVKELEEFKKKKLEEIKKKEIKMLQKIEEGEEIIPKKKLLKLKEDPKNITESGLTRFKEFGDIGQSFHEDIQRALKENQKETGVKGILKVKENKFKEVEWEKIGEVKAEDVETNFIIKGKGIQNKDERIDPQEF